MNLRSTVYGAFTTSRWFKRQRERYGETEKDVERKGNRRGWQRERENGELEREREKGKIERKDGEI